MKKNIKLILIILILITISCSSTVFAYKVIRPNELSYKYYKTTANNVQESIDKLYERIGKCPEDQDCLDENAKLICKRATTLHTDTCNNTNCTDTPTITYGQLGTKGQLVEGDAFDCDVNGDGVYDSTTERFYYLSNITNTHYALVYYNNTLNGLPNSGSLDVYFSSNNLGPDNIVNHLPTTTQWSNVRLKNELRNIETSDKKIIVENFSYENKSARLLTYAELYNACVIDNNDLNINNSLSRKCMFLLENTKYANPNIEINGYWTESRFKTNSVWNIYGYDGRINEGSTTGKNYGVRPVIEIKRTELEY